MGLSRPERLAAFLAAFDDAPVDWGKNDCSAAPALWVRQETGAAVVLPAYASREEALALKLAHGLAALWGAALPGFEERIGMPQLGDVGVIPTRRYGDIGVIFGAHGAAFWRREQGGWFGIVPRASVKVWALG